MAHRTIEKMAEIVVEIYDSEFRGKKRGRFALTKEQVKEISGRSTLQDTIIDKLIDELYEQGYSMTYVDIDLYSIIKRSILCKFRKPTKAALAEAINNCDEWD